MNFYLELIKELVIDSGNNFGYDDNYDHERFGKVADIPISFKGHIRKKIERIFNDRGYEIVQREDLKKSIEERLVHIEPYLTRIERFYDLLSNDSSKKLLVKILSYRVLGFTKVKLPTNTPEYWQGINDIRRLANEKEFVNVGFSNWQLPLINLSSKGIPIQLYFHPAGTYIDFVFKQYAYSDAMLNIKAEKGDYVIDAGGCWGDTALYFANEVGELGRVFTYEFIPSNLVVMTKNLALNPNLGERITIIENPAWEISELAMYYTDNGPGSRVSFKESKEDNGKCESLSIDDLVFKHGINKVNFIKMDIEGAEPHALKGAIRTIEKFRPKLAIAIYHSLDDFVDIPTFIHNLGLGYKLYLSHSSIHAEETILFAKIPN